MSETLTLWIIGVVFVVSSVLSLRHLRRNYQRRGKLGRIGSLVHVMMFVINGMFVGMLIWGTGRIPPMRGLPWLGVPLVVVGLGTLVSAMDLFRGFSRWLGSATPGLRTHGVYSLSRNPQFVGYGLSIIGAIFAWGEPRGWLGLFGYGALVHFVVHLEEEHLQRVYGQAYRDYCERVPRFVGWGRVRRTTRAD